MDTIKQLSIKESSGTGYIERDIGAEAQNIEVSYDASGNIINDINASGVVIDHTQGVSKTFNDFKTSIDGKAVKNHASNGTDYGVASDSVYGHVKTSIGITNNSGTISVKYGNAAGTACVGNDSRLSDKRNTPNSITFSNSTSGAASSGVTFDGSSAVKVSYNTIGAAPSSHVTSIATNSDLGHIKIGTGLEGNANGVVKVAFGTSSTTACRGDDSRLSNSRTPISHGSSSANTYGAGTSAQFGHVKLSNNYTSSAGDANSSVGASSYAVAQVYSTLNQAVNGKAPIAHRSGERTYGGGDSTYFGHVKLSDEIDSNIGAAADSIGASQTALYNVGRRIFSETVYNSGSTHLTMLTPPTGGVKLIAGTFNIDGINISTPYSNMYFGNFSFTFPSSFCGNIGFHSINITPTGSEFLYTRVDYVSGNTINFLIFNPEPTTINRSFYINVTAYGL